MCGCGVGVVSVWWVVCGGGCGELGVGVVCGCGCGCGEEEGRRYD